MLTTRCYYCGAEVPHDKMGKDIYGRNICCPACLFHPMGCRCKYGEFGVVETYVDPDESLYDPEGTYEDFGDELWDDEIDDWDSDYADEWDDLEVGTDGA